jgi:alkanesulfonate monooxygenase SsuD/methylene tetrahydromethanopterin reductase-like flavin-dependent oxidoreductase (luciferase family)
MEFYFFHLMPWPHIPDDFDTSQRSAWVTFSNKHYDPERGHALYNRYLDELEYAETLGFDGLCVNEHHQTTYGTMPAPNLMAAALARRTSRAKIAILGNALPLRDHPLRIAEEVAMLDVLSGGRIIAGHVRGIGAEYHTFSMSPAFSRERFLEAHELIIRAWTEAGPFPFEGKHYRHRYVNIWPRPLQKPHPPIWIPSQGSRETVEWAAQRRYPYLMVYSSIPSIKKIFDEYRECARRAGYEAPPGQLGWMTLIYVADTDRQARAEAEPHALWLFGRGLKNPPEYLFPPGYMTVPSMLRQMQMKDKLEFGKRTFEELEGEGYVVAGSPETVARRIRAVHAELGFGILTGLLQFGPMPHEQTVKSMELFARKVMPQLRPL